MKPAKFWFLLPAIACLAGCAVGPNYHTPDTKMPGNYSAVTSAPNPNPPASPPAPPTDLAQWWKSFNDPTLNQLVERAIQTNPDIEIALDRLQQARETEAIAIGTALPQGGFSAGAGVGTGSNSVKGRISAPLNAATNTAGYQEITEVAGFDAGWELDLFGRLRREIEADRDDVQAAAEARNVVLTAVIADVAKAYFEARALELQLAITQNNIHTEQQTLDFVQARYDRGITNELDVALSQRQLESVEAQIAPLQAELSATHRRMAVLLGTFPEDLATQIDAPATLPQLPAQIQPGLPVDLLQRRPDIRVAERQLAASTARIGEATAELFPRIGVTAGIGIQGQGLNREPEQSKSIWSAGPTAYWPLLDFGTIDAAIAVQDYHTHELLVNYKRTILNAVEEVDDAIANYAAGQDSLTRLNNALIASKQAVNLASQRYDRGLTDFLNVLDAERQMYSLQEEYASTQETAVLQYIAVYKGLGGGWENYQSVPAVHQPMPAIIATVQRLVSVNDPEK